jgi:uncharacterized protein (DUF1330 family)
MPAYVIAELDIHDMEGYRTYGAQALPTILEHGGRPLVASSNVDVLEGDRPCPRLVILEFPDMDTAKKWYASDAYAGPKKLREQIASTVMLMVDGWSPPSR